MRRWTVEGHTLTIDGDTLTVQITAGSSVVVGGQWPDARPLFALAAEENPVVRRMLIALDKGWSEVS